jgi:hypothetical protein
MLTLVLLLGAGEARGDYVTNGGFETGNFNGWTLSGNSSQFFVSPSAAFTGNFGAAITTNDGMGFLSQTVTTPIGSPLDLTFFLAGDGNTGETNEIKVSWNGTVLLDQTNFTDPNFNAFKLTVTPTSATNTLQLGFENDSGFFSLDDVSLNGRGVATAPEPGSLALLGLGGVLVGGFVRRRKPALA